MATKKRAGSKKGTASKSKKKPLVVNDPPIVISGGGGVIPLKPGRRGSHVRIKYRNTNNVQTTRVPRHNTSGDITGAVVELTTTQGGVTSTQTYPMISDDKYEISVTFTTT